MAGYFCPHNEETVHPNPSAFPCPKGHRCSQGVADPVPCEPGYYQNVTGMQSCMSTPAGYYSNDGVSLVECPEGYYCLESTETRHQYPCPRGTLNNITGLRSADECTICPQGFFCGTVGLAVPSGPCAEGFFCGLGAIKSDPTGRSMVVEVPWSRADVVVSGSHCLDVTARMTGEVRLGDRTDCTSSVVVGARELGAHGQWTITMSSQVNADGARERSDYIAVKIKDAPPVDFYNSESVVRTITFAGHRVDYQINMVSNNSNSLLHHTLEKGLAWLSTGDICPKGTYCPAGSKEPLPCPAGTFANVTGLSRCHPCSPGKYCGKQALHAPEGTCLIGFFCVSGASMPNPVGNDRSGGPCPTGKYSSLAGASSPSACLPCRAGYTCTSAGTSNMTLTVCPAGAYCPAGSTQPLLCNNGTYRNNVGGKSFDDCTVCRAGFYCPAGDKTGNLICPRGTYCPERSEHYRYCPAGTFSRLTAQSDGSQYRKDLTVDCPACPAGTFSARAGSWNCSTCEAGYICLGKSQTATPVNSTDTGYPCPVGAFCEAGAEKHEQCPRGTYSQAERLQSEAECLACDEGTYGDLLGATGCKTCGSSSTSERRSEQCKCIGENRAFQPSDGSCLCQPGYIFVDEAMQESTEDSRLNCQEKVFERCDAEGYVYNSLGECVDSNTVDCSTACPSGKGTFSSTFGFCECQDMPDVDDVCDSVCRQNQLLISVVSVQAGDRMPCKNAPCPPYPPDMREQSFVAIRNQSCVGSAVSVKAELKCTVWVPVASLSTSSVQGDITCTAGGCKSQTIAMGSNGFEGMYDVPADEYARYLGIDSSELSSLSTDSAARRALQVSNASQSSAASVTNPLVCLDLGDSIFFDLSHGTYPKYQVNSLLNTNAEFDYGAFRELERNMIKSNSPSTNTFVFAFSRAGTYVFANSGNLQHTTIVRVMKDSEICPTSAGMVAAVSTNLITLGITKSTDHMTTAPDWKLIIIVIAAMVSFVVGLVLTMCIYKRRALRRRNKREPAYRAKEKGLEDLATKQTMGLSSQDTQLGGPDMNEDMLGFTDDYKGGQGGMDAQGIMDKLDEQTVLIISELEKEIADMRSAIESGVGNEQLTKEIHEKLLTLTQARAGGHETGSGRSPDDGAELREQSARHAEERLELENRLHDRAQQEVEELHVELETQKQAVLDAERDKFQARIDAELDPAAKANLEAQRDRDLQRLEDLLSAEEVSAQDALERSLEQQLNLELDRLEKKQQGERGAFDLEAQHTRNMNRLEKQHDQAEQQLETEMRAEQEALDAELKAKLAEANSLEDVDWRSEKDRLQNQYETDMGNLTNTLANKRSDMQRKLKERLHRAARDRERKCQLEQQNQAELLEAVHEQQESAKVEELEDADRHVVTLQQQLEKKQQQRAGDTSQGDVDQLMAKLKEEQEQQREDTAKLRRQRKAELQARLEERRRKARARHGEDSDRAAEELRQRTDMEISSCEQEAEAEAAAAEASAESKMDELEAEVTRRRAEIDNSDLSDQERDRLMKALELETANRRRSLEESRRQQQQRLRDRLSAKKQAIETAGKERAGIQQIALEAAQQDELVQLEQIEKREQAQLNLEERDELAAQLQNSIMQLDARRLAQTNGDEERNALMQEMQREFDAMQDSLTAEKAARRQKLADRINAKKKALHNKHGGQETAVDITAVQEELAEEENVAQGNLQLAAQDMVQLEETFERVVSTADIPEDAKQNLVQQYKEEQSRVEAQHARERDAHRNALQRRLEEKRRALQTQQDEELRAVGVVLPSKQREERSQVEAQAQQELDALEESFAAEIEQALSNKKQALQEAADGVSAEEGQTLVQDYRKEKSAYLNQMNVDHATRRQLLQERLLKKQEATRKRHAMEIAADKPEARVILQQQEFERMNLEAAISAESTSYDEALSSKKRHHMDQQIAASLQALSKQPGAAPGIVEKCAQEMEAAQCELRDSMAMSKTALRDRLAERKLRNQRQRVEVAASNSDDVVTSDAAEIELQAEAERKDAELQISDDMLQETQKAQAEAVAAANTADGSRLRAQFEADQRALEKQMEMARRSEASKIQARLDQRRARLAARAAREADQSEAETQVAAEMEQAKALEQAKLESQLAEQRALLQSERLMAVQSQKMAEQAATESSANLTQKSRDDQAQFQAEIARQREIRHQALQEKFARKKQALQERTARDAAAAQKEFLQQSKEVKASAEAEANAMVVDVDQLVAFVEEQDVAMEDQSAAQRELAQNEELASGSASIDRESLLEEQLLQTYADIERRKLQLQAEAEKELEKMKAQLQAEHEAALAEVQASNNDLQKQKEQEIADARQRADAGDESAKNLLKQQMLEQKQLDQALNKNLASHKEQLQARLQAKIAKQEAAAAERLKMKADHLELQEEQKIVELTTQLLVEKDEQEWEAQQRQDDESELRALEAEKQKELEEMQQANAQKLVAASSELQAKQAAAATEEEKRRLFEAHERDVKEQRVQFEADKAKEGAKLQRRLNAKLEQRKHDRELKRQAERERRDADQREEAERMQRELEESQKSAELAQRHLEEQQRIDAEMQRELEAEEATQIKEQLERDLAAAKAQAAAAASAAMVKAVDEEAQQQLMKDLQLQSKEQYEALEQAKAKKKAQLEARLAKRKAALKMRQEEETRKRAEDLQSRGIHTAGSSVKNLLRTAQGLVDKDELSQAKDVVERQAALRAQLAAAREAGDTAAVQQFEQQIMQLESKQHKDREAKLAAKVKERQDDLVESLDSGTKKADAEHNAKLQREKQALRTAVADMAPEHVTQAVLGVTKKR
jgi:hypothetical protein